MLKILGKADKASDNWTVTKIVDYCEGKETIFDNAVQRGLEWNNEKKSRLIRSSILDRPMPPIFMNKLGEIFNNLDGKQRTFTWVEFYHDGFALEGLDPILLEDTETGEIQEIDLNGKKFSELPSILQKAIMSFNVPITIVNNATEDEEQEYFYDWNNGKPLNAITITRARMKSRKQIIELGSHELFKNALTEKALAKYTNEDIVIKSWAVLHQDEPSLETKVIRPLMAEVEITQEDIDQLNACFDRVLEACGIIEDKKIRKRLLTRTHLIGIMRVVWDSIQRGLSVEQFAEWFCSFFSGKKSATIDSDYNNHAGAGSAKALSVKCRLDAIQKSYNEFYNKVFDESTKAVAHMENGESVEAEYINEPREEIFTDFENVEDAEVQEVVKEKSEPDENGSERVTTEDLFE